MNDDKKYPYLPKDCPHNLQSSPRRMSFDEAGNPVIESTGATVCSQCGSEFLTGDNI